MSRWQCTASEQEAQSPGSSSGTKEGHVRTSRQMWMVDDLEDERQSKTARQWPTVDG